MAVLTDRLPVDSKGLEAEGHPRTTRAVLGACEAASDTRDMPKDIATQMARRNLASSDYRLPFGNRYQKGARYRPFFVSRF